MERKINKEIREYREAMFWGLTLRQFLFSTLGLGIYMGIYFLLRAKLGMEAVSWACIFGMLPCALLNSLDSNATTKITINNRKLNQADFEKRIFIKEQDDNLNEYRREYNQMLLAKATAGNSIIQEKYITVTVTEKSAEDARQYFNCFGASLAIQLNKLGSKCTDFNRI